MYFKKIGHDLEVNIILIFATYDILRLLLLTFIRKWQSLYVSQTNIMGIFMQIYTCCRISIL